MRYGYAACLLAVVLISTNAEARRYHAHVHHTDRMEGIASFVDEAQGTASGRRFNPNDMVAAHPTLPFGTKIRVTNKHNGRSVVVTVIDRGPFTQGRVVDVSLQAARDLHMYAAGVAPVKIDVVTDTTDEAHAEVNTTTVASVSPVDLVLAPIGIVGAVLGGAGNIITSLMDPVDQYLCDVYNRMPVKEDSTGNFTWKDQSAAKRMHMDTCHYAIGGMNRDFREALYAVGHEADKDGIRWSFLSAFRDDYRQKIATGFKASTCGSMHGGSCRTKGYGDGRAADIWEYSDNGKPKSDAHALFRLVDRIGRKFGLSRPMPGADPAHVQVSGAWHEVGRRLRMARTGVPDLPTQVVQSTARHHVASHARRHRAAPYAHHRYRHRHRHYASR